MSEVGQSRRFDPLPVTSGLPPNIGHQQTGPIGPVRANKRHGGGASQQYFDFLPTGLINPYLSVTVGWN